MKTKPSRTPIILNWDMFLSVLPLGWEALAKEKKAFVRKRKFSTAGDLLQTLMLHVADDLPLQETAALVSVGGKKVSHMAIQRRLKQSPEWIEGICVRMVREWGGTIQAKKPEIPIHIIDATTSRQPGSTGTDQRVHLELDVHADRTASVQGTDAHTGETFRNFAIQKNVLYMGDRTYGNRPGIAHVVAGGGYVLVRINAQNLPLQTPDGKTFNLLGALRTLPEKKPREWAVIIPGAGDIPSIPGRVCARRLPAKSREQEEKRAREQAQKKGHQVKPETLEMAGYLAVFTTLPKRVANTRKVLACFKGRWQVEIAFKRDKQTMNLGECPKLNPQAARAWRALKLLSLLLVEALRRKAEDFSPSVDSGATERERAQPLAGMGALGSGPAVGRHSVWVDAENTHEVWPVLLSGTGRETETGKIMV